MKNNLKIMQKEFNGKLIGNAYMKKCVLETLVKMPKEIIAFITRRCWFFASMEDAWGYTFTGNDLRNQHMIFLSDELLSQNQSQICFTIAHEIGHIILGHKNSTIYKQSKTEIRHQEIEANNFANQFLPKNWPN